MGISLLRLFNGHKPVESGTDNDVQAFSLPGSTGSNPCSDWAQKLDGLVRDLHTLCGSTEGEFLEIGAKLHDFYQRAGEIEQISTTMVGQVAGGEIHETMTGLREILAHMADYMNTEESEAEASCTTLENILGLLDNVAHPLDGFKKINKTLRMLGTATKIESARLGQSAAGFDTLASDVEVLSVQVLEKSGTIAGQKDGLSAIIRQTLVQIEAMEAEQRVKVRKILDKTHESLTSLCEINARCSSAAELISAASSEVSRNISEVVTSMQFHDITRQQIEHVYEALSEQSERLREKSSASVDDTIHDVVCEAGDICELQSAQLGQACDELMTAVDTITQNLLDIARKEAHMSGETRQMAGVADQAGSSFFTEMENGISVVTTSLTENAAANRNMAEAMNTVAGTVETIVDFVSDIENIGEEIELIALNAQIKAARTGTEGAALGVLAEAIQRLSVDARLQTTTVSDTLRSITMATENLCLTNKSETTALDEDVHEMISRLSGFLHSLREVNENLIDCLAGMEKTVESLSRDIKTLTSGITVHVRVAEAGGQVINHLNSLVAEARALVPSDLQGSASERLRILSSRYTMHSERKLHDSFTSARGGAGIAESGRRVSEAAGGDGNEYGDNVELF